jgi:hypothetical protein
VSFFPCLRNKLKKQKLLINSRVGSLVFAFSGSDIVFALIIFSLVMIARIPSFLPPMLNPDEVNCIVGANKLLKDMVFWRSVDGTTSGPLNFYPLMIAHLFDLKIEYATARIIGAILVIGSLLCLYFALKIIYNKKIARISLIPTTLSFAGMNYFDYIHYTSELPSVFLLSLSLLLIVYFCKREGNCSFIEIFSLGLLLGIIPYAKLQSLPIIFCLFIIFLSSIFPRQRNLFEMIKTFLYLLAGFLFCSIFVLMITIFVGIEHDFLISYFLSTLSISGVKVSLFKKMFVVFPKLIAGSNDLLPLFITAILIISRIGILVKVHHSFPEKKRSSTFFFVYYSLFFFIFSVISIIQPGRPFRHYLLFLTIPSGFIIGVFIGEFSKLYSYRIYSKQLINILIRKRLKSIADKTFGHFQKVKLQPSQSINQSNLVSKSKSIVKNSILEMLIFLFFGHFVFFTIYLFCSNYVSIPNHFESVPAYIENYSSNISKTVSKYTSPEEEIAIWGWATTIYEETDTIPATRDTHGFWQLKSSSFQNYYIDRFIRDLIEKKPKIFINAVTNQYPVYGAALDNDNEYGISFSEVGNVNHDSFIRLKKLIDSNYKMIEEIEGVKIFKKLN